MDKKEHVSASLNVYTPSTRVGVSGVREAQRQRLNMSRCTLPLTSEGQLEGVRLEVGEELFASLLVGLRDGRRGSVRGPVVKEGTADGERGSLLCATQQDHATSIGSLPSEETLETLREREVALPVMEPAIPPTDEVPRSVRTEDGRALSSALIRPANRED